MAYKRTYPIITETQMEQAYKWANEIFPLTKNCMFCGVSPKSISEQWHLEFRYMPAFEPALGSLEPDQGIPTAIVVCPNCGFVYTFTLFEHSGILPAPPASE